MNDKNVLLRVTNLQKYFPIKKKSIFQKEQYYVRANKDITIDIYEGETLGLVGESGSGKSTFGRTLIQLYKPTKGVALYYGDTIENLMPKYVKKIYNSLPKTSLFYDRDNDEIKLLESELAVATTSEREELIEKIRLKRIAFDNKYSNIVRLGGGLLVHHDLNYVRSLLLSKYYVGSKAAKFKRQIKIMEFKRNTELIREKLELEKATDSNETTKSLKSQEIQEKIDAKEKELQSVEKKLKQMDEKIDAEKELLKSHPKFKHYESKLDYGIDLSSLTYNEMRGLRRDLQIIFQDPYSSLDPRMTVGNIVGEGLMAHKIFTKKGAPYEAYIKGTMKQTGLDENYIHRFPHQFSGGQRQRIGIARSLALKPKFIVCDEAVSALDVSIQSQIINLLMDLKEEHKLTYLFITHDLNVVRFISDRIGVMYLGNLVELAPAEEIFKNPQHPYTKELLNAIPKMNFDGTEDAPLPLFVDNGVFDFTHHLTGEADTDWYEVTPQHFVACRLLNK